MTSARWTFTGSSRERSKEEERRLKNVRGCFRSFERFLESRRSQPTADPSLRNNLDEAVERLGAQSAQISVGLSESGFHEFETGGAVWTTETAAAAARSAITTDIRFLNLRPDVERSELHRFLDLLGRLAEGTADPDPIVDLEFEAVQFERVDRSGAVLGGISTSTERTEPDDEARATQKLFNRSFDTTLPVTDGRPAEESLLEHLSDGDPFDVSVDPGAQLDALHALRCDLVEPEQTEVRRTAAISSALVDALDASTRNRLLETVRRSLVSLLERGHIRGAQRVLEEIDPWRDELPPLIEEPTLRRLLEAVTLGENERRNRALEFFDVWSDEETVARLAELFERRLPDAVEADLVDFFAARFDREAERLPELVDRVTTERALELVEAAASNLPEARRPLLELLDRDVSDDLKSRALQALSGHFAGLEQIEEYVVPLVGSPHSKLRNAAIQSLVEIAPDQVGDALAPFINETLADRSNEDLVQIVRPYARCADAEAVEKLGELIRVRRLGSDEEIRLGVRIVDALEGVDVSNIERMLEEIGGEWMVAGDVREACKRVLESGRAER